MTSKEDYLDNLLKGMMSGNGGNAAGGKVQPESKPESVELPVEESDSFEPLKGEAESEAVSTEG